MRQSIESVINQTYKNWELIIIDDCSSDNTPTIAQEYVEKDNRIKYYRNETNLKLPKGLNRGFSLSKGDYLTWTSDDNLYLPTAIERMVSALETKKTDFVFATCDVINQDGNVIEIIKAPKDYQKAILHENFVGACFLYTRKVYETIGEYDPSKILVEDYDYWLRIFCRFEVSNIQDALYQYRWHDDALTSTEKKDTINIMCEKVILDNLSSYGKLSTLQKYYLYSQLNKLRQSKSDPKERDKYKLILIRYRLYYTVFHRIPNRLFRIITN